MDYLSRREHSAKEIYRKLSRRVESQEDLEFEIEKLQNTGLLSDERFAESYTQSRKNKGFGPLRIKNELRERGVSDSIVNNIVDPEDWSKFAEASLQKKTGGIIPVELKKIVKLKRFLNYRGFNFSDIDKAFSSLKG
jgi:regulatory protein|tara:strand:+ start:136 stop:546 length:411 start_codon:yes stop_codon:yes gene_type:complete